MNELLKVNEVSISFRQYVQGLKQKNLEVITDLSLDVREGEIVAILGSSGSGKSLLAHSILGILPETVEACDGVVHLPMFGNKSSINVGNAAAAVLYAVVAKCNQQLFTEWQLPENYEN